MKAKELMIGDRVVKPTGSRFPMFALDFANSNEWFDNVKPIPLTPEIFKKNGFIYNGNGYDCEFYNINNSQVWGCLTRDGFNIAFGRDYLPSGIILSYVHELQHALRLCGLNEIADNFKV